MSEGKKDNPKERLHLQPHPGVQEINFREGEYLPEIRQPVKVRISGNIMAPSEFYKIRKKQGLVFEEEAHVEVDRWDGKVKLYVNEKDVEATIVTGSLDENPDIKKLQINTGQTYNKEDLVTNLKLNRHLFDDVQKNMKLVKDLQQLEMTVEQKLEKKDDHRGSRSEVLRQTAESDLDTSFSLNIPIFRGQEPWTFEVELNFSVRDSRIEFWLSSPELAELQGSQQFSIIEQAIEVFKEDDIVIIEK